MSNGHCGKQITLLEVLFLINLDEDLHVKFPLARTGAFLVRCLAKHRGGLVSAQLSV